MEDDYNDTHMCLACQTTFLGLENYIIHKRNGCPSGDQVQRNNKLNNSVIGAHNDDRSRQLMPEALSDIRHLEASLHGAPSLDGHSYALQNMQVKSDDHFRDSMAGSSASAHDTRPGYMTLPTCQTQSTMPQEAVLVSSARHSSTTYMPSTSQQHMPLEATDHSISSLLGVHSSNDHYHSEDRMSSLNRMQTSSHSLESAINHTLPSIRTFRSCDRLLPTLRQDSGDVVSQQALHASLPFTHVPHTAMMHTQEGLSNTVRRDIHSHQVQGLNSHPSSSSGIDLSLSTQHHMNMQNSHHIIAPQSSTGPSIGSEVSDAVASFVSNLSPNSSRVVDQNIELYEGLSEKDTTFTDFFSSLELQYRVESDPSRHVSCKSEKPGSDNDSEHHLKESSDAKYDMDQHKAIHIANILNELAFSSDSDNMLPSDAEHLFDSTDDEGTSNMHCPPPAHTGGKYVPGQRQRREYDSNGRTGFKQTETHDSAQRPNLSENELPGKSDNSKQGHNKYIAHTGKSNNVVCKGNPGKQKSGISHKDVGSKHKTGLGGKGAGGKLKSSAQGMSGKLKVKLAAFEGSALTSRMVTGKLRIGLGRGKAMGGKMPNISPTEAVNAADSDHDDLGNLSDDEQEEDAENIAPVKVKCVSRGKVFPSGKLMPSETFYCKPCDEKLLNKFSYDRHCFTTAHMNKCPDSDESSAQDSDVDEESNKDEAQSSEKAEDIECQVCDKVFQNKYSFSRHLLTSIHQKNSLNHGKSLLLDRDYQLLLSRQSRFQCHICRFYCNTPDQLLRHIETDQHEKMVESLLGPVLCVRCKFASSSNAEMLDHIASEQHSNTLLESDRPCILRESKFRIQCRDCDKTFLSAMTLKTHVIKEHQPKVDSAEAPITHVRPPTCPHCNLQLSSNFRLKSHIRRKHTFEKPYYCDVCDKKFYEKSSLGIHKKSKKHLEKVVEVGDVRPVKQKQTGVLLELLTSSAVPKHFEKPPETKAKKAVTHKCTLCDFTAQDYKDLRPHFLKEHLKSVLACEVCGIKFVSERRYNIHLATSAHRETEDESFYATKTFMCLLCDRKFYCPKKYLLHKLLHQRSTKQRKRMEANSKLGVDKKHFDFLNAIKDVPLGQRVSCPVCRRSITKQQIYTHLRLHDGSSPFGCIYCSKTFSCPKSLRRHLAIHLGIKSHFCKICNRKFPRETALMIHKKIVHTKWKRSFKCDVCKGEYLFKWRLQQHMLEHSKPVACTFAGCTKSFSNKSKMLIHMRQHSGEKPYLCSDCGYSARTQQYLNRHRRTHTGERRYQCEYCDYRALNKTNLSRHMRIHIGTKPYKCPYCDFTCNTHSNIRKHVMKTQKHVGKSVYPCRVCNDYGTNSASDFKKHLAVQHLIEDQEVDLLSQYAGLYNKKEDATTLPEGARVIPTKERRRHVPPRPKPRN